VSLFLEDSVMSNEDPAADSLPPPSETESLSPPPPSPSVDDTNDDDTMEEDTHKKRKAATRTSRKERDSQLSGGKMSPRTSLLSDGLDPKLVKMGESLASIDDTNEGEGSDEEEESIASQALHAPRIVDYSNKRGSIIVNGQEYILLQGKFEGDEFEQLMVKVESNMLFVKTPVDENVIIPFDLGIDTQAKRDEHDDTVFYLNQQGQLITFQADSSTVVNDLFAKFPADTIVLEFEDVPDDHTSSSSSSSSSSTTGSTYSWGSVVFC